MIEAEGILLLELKKSMAGCPDATSRNRSASDHTSHRAVGVKGGNKRSGDM
jgi:hypothetical protein